MKIADKKTALREQLLKNRNVLSLEEWERKSSEIHERLKSLIEIKQGRCIHSYISMANRKEVDTLQLIRYFLANDKQVMVPVIHSGTYKLDHSFLPSIDHLKPHKWGVLEPEDVIAANPADADLILVPMVGADEKKNRIGYGKGFYDRFLAESSQIKIGLCFECTVVNELPVDHFDVPLDVIVTEKRIIR